MWILFGTYHNTIENEPHACFIGIFDNFELVNKIRNELIIKYSASRHDYFIKDVKMNEKHDYSWSNCDDV
jgi:hypothetical protein